MASLSITSNCNHTALAPIAIASSTTLPTSVELTKQSTTSTDSGISDKVVYPVSPCTTSARGYTGIIRCPLSCRSFATPNAARSGLLPRPTTAHVLSARTASMVSLVLISTPQCVEFPPSVAPQGAIEHVASINNNFALNN